MELSNQPLLETAAEKYTMQCTGEISNLLTLPAKPKISPKKLALDAIKKLNNPKGSSYADIRKFLNSNNELVKESDLKNLKLFLINAVDRGILSKEGGKYRIKSTAKGKRSKSKTPRKPRSSKKTTRVKRGSSAQKTRKRSVSKTKKGSRKSQAIK